ncbi:MAG: hypothetical protein QOI78_2862 [Actinomycetota bacterium]|jgi:hypothetical protein|nr:hypothetical protein [Actinomycetota bacterium]
MNKIGRTLTSLAGAMTLLLAGAGIAGASLRDYPDDFEVNPASMWHVQTLGSGNAGFDYNIGTARGGRGNGWLHSGYSASSASAEGTWVSTGNGGGSSCRASVYANPLNDRSREILAEVFNSRNERIASAELPLAYGGYQEVGVNFWLPGYDTVFVRYALYDSGRGYDGEWVRLDDFLLRCTW